MIDGDQRGETPLRITVPSGTHTVEFTLQGYQSSREIVETVEDETQTVRMTLPALPSVKSEASIQQRSPTSLSETQKEDVTIIPA